MGLSVPEYFNQTPVVLDESLKWLSDIINTAWENRYGCWRLHRNVWTTLFREPMKKEDWLLGKPPITTAARDVHERFWQPWLDAALEEAVSVKKADCPSDLCWWTNMPISSLKVYTCPDWRSTAHAIACIRNAGRRRD